MSFSLRKPLRAPVVRTFMPIHNEPPPLTPEQEIEMQKIRKACREEIRQIRESQRITAEDLAFRVNCTERNG